MWQYWAFRLTEGDCCTRYASREKISYPVLLDRKGEVFVGKFTITSLPAAFIIDREGCQGDIKGKDRLYLQISQRQDTDYPGQKDMTKIITIQALAAIMLTVFLVGCDSTTFIISKNSKAYYFGRDSKVLRAMLCDSGELKEILSETTIDEDIRNELYRYNCTDEHSKEKVVSIYSF